MSFFISFTRWDGKRGEVKLTVTFRKEKFNTTHLSILTDISAVLVSSQMLLRMSPAYLGIPLESLPSNDRSSACYYSSVYPTTNLFTMIRNKMVPKGYLVANHSESVVTRLRFK
jgi:hypothetical protein